jgi:hypothetical protein
LGVVPNVLTLPGLREVVDSCIADLASWFVAKPRLFDLPRPEQQIQFELASRLRERLRERTANPTWDRLHYDAADTGAAHAATVAQRPPIYVDARQLYGSVSSPRSPAEPDLALAVHVVRSIRSEVEFDENGNPAGQTSLPLPISVAGSLVEQRVIEFDRLSHQACDCALLVIYSNDARRRTAIDKREVASWASWQAPLDTLWWTVRHFRAKAR